MPRRRAADPVERVERGVQDVQHVQDEAPVRAPRLTKKAFREYLNQLDRDDPTGSKHRHFQYGQRTRLYGDYLYAQDREKFDVDYQEWVDAHTDAAPSVTGAVDPSVPRRRPASSRPSAVARARKRR